MARLVAAFRLLLLLVRRDLKELSSLGLNNLFLCAAFLVQGSHNARTAFFAALPFLVVLSVPLLFSLSADTLERIPKVRARLLPLSVSQRFLLSVASLAISPAFWFFGGVLALWGGVAAGLCFVLLAGVVQALVFIGASVLTGVPRLRVLQYVPRLTGKLGGVMQVSLRQIFSSLDFYAAAGLSLAGIGYRFLAPHPQREAFPVMALLVAVAMSTYAQRMFGLYSAGGLVRYRLLPVEGWRILLAKDLVYLGVVGLLTVPLGALTGLTFSLVAIGIGRYPSLRQRAAQKPWRFTGGDVRFGAAQIVGGGLVALGCLRVSRWFLVLAAGIYLSSIVAGEYWWRAPRDVVG